MSMALEKHASSMSVRRTKLKWDNISFLIAGFVTGLLVIWILKVSVFAPYEIQYVEHHVQDKDTIINLVQDMNDYTPFGWDARDFVALALDKNNMSSGAELRAGQTIYIPVAKGK